MTRIRDENYLIALGKRINEIRRQKGISTYELALSSNVSRSQINAIERGQINTTISTIKALATALDIELKELFDF